MVELEAGKYYKTRDGRKVGPIDTFFNNEFTADVEPTEECSVHVAVWASNGKNSVSCLDIVAEWDGSPHPAASTGAQREKLDALPYDLVPFQEIAEAYSRVAEKGAQKYSAWNWSKGLARVQILGSLLRHTFAYLRGEDRDGETGLLHTDHILWNAVALSHNVHWNLEDGRRGEPVREYKALDKSARDV